jgi:hypothetical protein
LKSWIPRPSRHCDVLALKLGPLEGFVLSRIDGSTDVEGLSLVTGLATDRLESILERLVGAGAVEAPQGAPPAASSPDAALPPRQLFETRLHPLSEDARAALAKTAAEPELSALCFDPVVPVIAQVLDNPRCGLAHARLIAAHHLNAAGLEALAARSEFLHDAEVQRFLLRNPQTPGHLQRRLLLNKRLPELYRVGQDRDANDRTRAAARELLRERFAKGSPDERVELIVITEGRALTSLTGLSLDGRTIALLCARPPASMLLVENLARWPASPPVLLAHLLAQPMVQRSPQLRAMVRRHPNAPRSVG